MATNAYVAVKTDSGYDTIYVHNDGYPDYMYPLLRDWYDSVERAMALVSFGDASFLAKRIMPSLGSGHCFGRPEVDVCIFYHRDGGESFHNGHYPDKQSLLLAQYYVYIYEDGCWKAYINGKEVDDYAVFGSL